eukprot:gene7314-8708_t
MEAEDFPVEKEGTSKEKVDTETPAGTNDNPKEAP